MKHEPIIIEKIYPDPISKVWKALTDKEQMEEWYFTIDNFELKKGASFDFSVPYEGQIFNHRFIIQEIIPEKILKHTWAHPGHSKGESMLTWSLEPIEGGTKVTLTHEGTENFAGSGPEFTPESYRAGWEEILGIYLKEFLAKEL
ncbi:SRPBCC domain-containing protein [Dysgonomonas sp. Marseille-P4677]|uniref:SRPBCC family protein n=1 Tax=Dysgonomonas sp. Marseille-P4677 TaxID=2364790 RepID=UPI00191493FE|nr:SRPBCC domain-containing protein [Dysgonomonas sp. Marseille-P4677]MBK5721842.1 SRPBCC domain-containing protein [Dysgonomonas sp. Marseille-P4677]